MGVKLKKVEKGVKNQVRGAKLERGVEASGSKRVEV